jgi:XRE family transcriptional regulator, regulator of sulfur utilization
VDFQTQLGRNLAAQRRAAEMTQEELSLESKVPMAQISKIENGKGNPQLRTLVRLATALEVPVGRLVAGLP